IRRCIMSAGNCPISIFPPKNGFGFAWSVDRDPIENVCIDANQVIVAQIGRLRINDLFDLFRKGVNGSTRGEPYVNLIFFFFWYAADLQRLTFVLSSKDLDRFAELNLLVFFLVLILSCVGIASVTSAHWCN